MWERVVAARSTASDRLALRLRCLVVGISICRERRSCNRRRHGRQRLQNRLLILGATTNAKCAIPSSVCKPARASDVIRRWPRSTFSDLFRHAPGMPARKRATARCTKGEHEGRSDVTVTLRCTALHVVRSHPTLVNLFLSVCLENYRTVAEKSLRFTWKIH